MAESDSKPKKGLLIIMMPRAPRATPRAGARMPRVAAPRVAVPRVSPGIAGAGGKPKSKSASSKKK